MNIHSFSSVNRIELSSDNDSESSNILLTNSRFFSGMAPASFYADQYRISIFLLFIDGRPLKNAMIVSEDPVSYSEFKIQRCTALYFIFAFRSRIVRPFCDIFFIKKCYVQCCSNLHGNDEYKLFPGREICP